MSNKDDLTAKREVIIAILPEMVEEPTIPVNAALQEAEDLHHWSLEDAELLNTVGITAEMIADLPVRAGACREAQSIWNKEYRSQQDAQKQWNDQSPESYDLRDELIHTFRYAYRKDSTALGRVAAIADGDGHADMIQDLNDLAVFGKENPESLSAIGFDLTKLDSASALSDEMASVLAASNGSKSEQNESKVLRDRAYTHMKEMVDEIRDAGKYLFWKDQERYKGYISKYWKKKKRTRSASEEPVE